MTLSPNAAPTYCLEVHPAANADATLEIALDGRGHPDGPGLEFLGGDFDRECWCAPESQLRAIVLSEPDDPDADAAAPAELLYRKLVRALGESRFGYGTTFPASTTAKTTASATGASASAAAGRWRPPASTMPACALPRPSAASSR